jgi:hypothetical protein
MVELLRPVMLRQHKRVAKMTTTTMTMTKMQ